MVEGYSDSNQYLNLLPSPGKSRLLMTHFQDQEKTVENMIIVWSEEIILEHSIYTLCGNSIFYE